MNNSNGAKVPGRGAFLANRVFLFPPPERASGRRRLHDLDERGATPNLRGFSMKEQDLYYGVFGFEYGTSGMFHWE
jgi:hypothetical protein